MCLSSLSLSRLILLGASIRAAAESARRAGFVPWGVDLFADEDLLATCPTLRIKQLGRELQTAFERLPASPWMYVGGLENHPRILAALARLRPLLGVPAGVVRAVRNPWRLDETLAPYGLALPELRRDRPSGPQAHEWLWKPLRSAGGCRIDWAGLAGANSGRRGYFQRFVPGTPCGAIYLGHGGTSSFLGVSQQLTGPDWSESPAFLYGGSIGPLPLDPSRRSQFEQLGQILVEQFQLVGLFGVDAIDDGSRLWPLEVNPRYTASVEVLERATGAALVTRHVAACQGRLVDEPHAAGGGIDELAELHGKAIVYARREMHANPAVCAQLSDWQSRRPWPIAADLPAVGTTVLCGAPLATVFAVGPTVAAVLESLRERVREILRVAR